MAASGSRIAARVAGAALAIGLLVGVPPAGAQAKGGASKPPPAAPALDPARARAEGAARALAWLETHLDRVPESQGSPRRPFTVAIAALDVLLAAGPTHDRTATARVRRDVAYLASWIDEVGRRSRDPSQLPARHGLADSRVLVQYTWPLGAALLLFAECRARGMLEAETTPAIRRAVEILAEAQDANGGFGHGRTSSGSAAAAPDPFPGMPQGLGGYPATLVSATNTVTVGLGLARPWLPRAADPVLARLLDHYPKAILPNGNFPYDVSQRSAGADATGVGRTAGAIAAMLALGRTPAHETVRRACAFLDPRIDGLAEGHGSPALNVLLGALQARMRGPEAVKAFEEAHLPRILSAQAADGSLDCVCTGRGFGVTCDSPEKGLGAGIPMFAQGQRAYVTALHLFALLLDRPDRMKALAPPEGGAPRVPETTPSDPRAGK